jgi:hypothetical protein
MKFAAIALSAMIAASPVGADDLTWRGFNGFMRGLAHRNDSNVYDSGTRRTGFGQDGPAGFINSADARRFVGTVTIAPNPIGATLDLYNRDVGDQARRQVVRITVNGMELFREVYRKDQSTNGLRREIHVPEFAYQGEGHIKVVMRTFGELQDASRWWGTATPNCEPRRAAPIIPPQQDIANAPKPQTKAERREARQERREDRSERGGKGRRK